MLKSPTCPGSVKKQEASYEVHSLHRGLKRPISKTASLIVRLTAHLVRALSENQIIQGCGA